MAAGSRTADVVRSSLNSGHPGLVGMADFYRPDRLFRGNGIGRAERFGQPEGQFLEQP